MQNTIRRGREHFPRPVDSLDELPAAVVDALAQHGAIHDLNQLVVIPPQKYPIPRRRWGRVLPFMWRWTPHRTLLFGDDQIVAVEGSDGDSLRTIVIPVPDVIAFQLDHVLLYSVIDLRWTAGESVACVRVEFNSVGAELIEHGVGRVQQAIAHRSLPRFRAAPPQALIRHFPLKFRNYARLSLLPDETIRFAVYQPAAQTSKGRMRRPTLAPNRVILLTDHHLIVIEDALVSSVNDKYRINRAFYPREKIIAARQENQTQSGWLCLTMGTPEANQDVCFPLADAHITGLLRAFDAWFLVKA